jgi:menaquinone-dependent protoporphyrinogen oxidase
MKKILVTYATNSGSTAEVAQVIAEELGKNSAKVEIRQINDVKTVDGYQAVVVGAPMIVGWHPSAVRFIKRNKQALSRMPVAYFFTALKLTKSDQHKFNELSISVDPQLAKPLQNPKRVSFKEKHASVDNYLPPALKAAPDVKPVSVGFFGGKLDIMRLKLWQKLFIMLVIQAKPGDFRNWSFIRRWANHLSVSL